MSKKKVAVIGQGKQEKPKSRLRPVIMIHVYDADGKVLDFDTLPYNGDATALTSKLEEMLDKYSHTDGVRALPTTGYELNL